MKRKIEKISLVLFVCLTSFIFLNSFRDAATSTSQSSPFVDFLCGVLARFGYFPSRFDVTVFVRKTAHFAEFAAQAVLLGTYLVCRYDKKMTVYILFTGLFTACCDEFIQMFPEGRSAEVYDVFIDFSGVVAGAVFYIIIFCILRRKEKENGFTMDSRNSNS